MRELWRRYLDGIPEYLARHYWWAYLSPSGVWFFDHRPIINLILFGQYKSILDEVMRRYEAAPSPRTLQLTCAYGAVTPALAMSPATGELHLMDAAAIQLRAAQRKLPPGARPVCCARMNAESLGYADGAFDTVIIFFLLHELPPDARARTLEEALRTLKPGGRLLIADYGHHTRSHLLHRLPPPRALLEKLEPFLHEFWHSDLDALLAAAAARHAMQLEAGPETPIFRGFYRVLAYRVR
jgi:ubiquinone/menaquinone biosynthesis C-methylase UbiE